GRLLSYSVDFDRRGALDLGSPFESVHRYVLQVPPAFRLDAIPKAQHVKSKWGFFRLNVKPDPKNVRKLELEFQTRLEKTRIEAGLWELTVKSAADFAETEAAYQEMVKRFPDETKYRVALGATRIKRGDYAGAKAVLEPLTKAKSAVIRAQAHYQLARNCAEE